MDPGDGEGPGGSGQPTVVGTATTAGGVLTSANGSVRIEIPAGAVTQSVEITVDEAASVPGSSDLVAGSAYTFGPDGLTFAKPVAIEIAYDPQRLPAGRSEASLGLYRATASAWEEVESVEVDSVGKTVTGWVSGFSSYAVQGGRVENIDGDWFVTESVLLDACENDVGGQYVFPLSISQTGSAIQVSVEGDTYSGTVDGSSVRWSGSYEEEGGMVTLSLSVAIDAGGDRFTGRSAWQYEGNGVTCGGASSFEGLRASSTDLAEIRITAKVNNVPQSASSLTLRPELGEALSFDVQTFGADGVELEGVIVELTSTQRSVLDIPSSIARVWTPATGLRPILGGSGAATLSAYVSYDDETVADSIAVTVERETTPITTEPGHFAMLNIRQFDLLVLDSNPNVRTWEVLNGTGQVVDDFGTLRCTNGTCRYNSFTSMYPAFGIGTPPPWGEQFAISFQGKNQAGAIVSASEQVVFTVMPARFNFELEGEDRHIWSEWGDIRVDPARLTVGLKEFAPGTTQSIFCPSDPTNVSAGIYVTTEDGREYESGVAGATCSGSVTIAPQPVSFANGRVWTITFSGAVHRVVGGTLESRNVNGQVEFVDLDGQGGEGGAITGVAGPIAVGSVGSIAGWMPATEWQLRRSLPGGESRR